MYQCISNLMQRLFCVRLFCVRLLRKVFLINCQYLVYDTFLTSISSGLASTLLLFGQYMFINGQYFVRTGAVQKNFWSV